MTSKTKGSNLLLKPKPFVKWVGGKRQLLAQFKALSLYPPPKFNKMQNTYFEPFLGGGAVFFDLMPKKAILSDLNLELVITYQVIKNEVEALISRLKLHEIEKEYFFALRDLNPHELSSLEVASRFIYLNRTCFNGLYRVNKKGEFNVSFGSYKNPNVCDETNLRKVASVLKSAKIEHSDYNSILIQAQKKDFIYLDPPYDPINNTSKFTSYTNSKFGQEEQIQLSETIEILHKRGCFVMLSNSNTDFIKNLYADLQGFKIHEVFANRAVNSNPEKRGKVSEVVIKNY